MDSSLKSTKKKTKAKLPTPREGRIALLRLSYLDSARVCVSVCVRPTRKLKTSEVKTGPPALTHFSKVSVAKYDKLLINLCLF